MSELDQLIAALQAVDEDITAREIADAVWLGLYALPIDKRHGLANQSAAARQASAPFASERPEDIPRTEESPDSGTQPRTKGSQPRTNASAEMHVAPRHGTSHSDGSLAVRTPRASALPNPLAFMRAFRPLRQWLPDAGRSVLHVSATVDWIADTHVWLPILRPAPRPRFALTLVLDESSSMGIWRDVAQELLGILMHHGGLRRVRTVGMKFSGGSLLLSTGISSSDGARYQMHERELVDEAGEHILLVMSDCASTAWYDGVIPAALARWSRRAHVAILQPLPMRMWRRTALGNYSFTAVGPSPGNAPGSTLTVDTSREHSRQDDHAPVPVMALMPEDVDAWSWMMSGHEAYWVKGVLLPTRQRPNDKAAVVSNVAKQPVTAQERVARFRRIASTTAIRLARLLSAAPLTLPVIRLIMEELLPTATLVHLAEIILGGLVRPTPEIDGSPSRTVVYEFLDGVRDILRQTTPIPEQLAVLSFVSRYVTQHWQSTRDFLAWVQPPRETQDWTETERPFAVVATELLQRMGGRYAWLAEQLEHSPSVEDPAARSGSRFDVFLSYSSPDKAWVRRLAEDLKRYGVSVEMGVDEARPGEAFQQALERELKQIRAVALVISSASTAAGWVKHEYNRALSLAQRKNDTLPIIPLLLSETELPSFLADRRCVDFRNPDAYSARVAELVWEITGKKPAQVLNLDVGALPIQPKQPPAPSYPVLPPGAHYLPDWYIRRPFEEETALGYLAVNQPVQLWGPRDQGCTWLGQHVARTWRDAAPDRRYVIVDFRSLSSRALNSLDTCLAEIATILDDSLPDDPERKPIADRWDGMRGDAKVRLTSFLVRTVLRALPGELLLVFDHAELVHTRPFYWDIAGLLRSWAEKRHDRAPWDRLRLLVSTSMHPARLRAAQHASPFTNLSDPIRVADFDRGQVAELARRHGLSWTDADITRLMELVGGHPYLVWAVMEDVGKGRYQLDDLAAGKARGRSRVDDYLQRDRTHLAAVPTLGQAFGSLVENPAAEVPSEALDDLIRLGLVAQGPNGTHPVRYQLFKRLLQQETSASAPRKLRVFYSYSRQDKARRDRLEVHLKMLEREGLIESWHDRLVLPGSEYDEEILRKLEAADLILLLISADFLASRYSYIETTRAMERHEAGEAKVVPIILSTCDWRATPIGKLQALPKEALPVSRWTDEDEAWADVTQALRRLITA